MIPREYRWPDRYFLVGAHISSEVHSQEATAKKCEIVPSLGKERSRKGRQTDEEIKVTDRTRTTHHGTHYTKETLQEKMKKCRIKTKSKKCTTHLFYVFLLDYLVEKSIVCGLQENGEIIYYLLLYQCCGISCS